MQIRCGWLQLIGQGGVKLVYSREENGAENLIFVWKWIPGSFSSCAMFRRKTV
jgi:hypothetical protein